MTALAPLGLLVLLLPFEPLRPIARGAGFEISFVELAAFVLLSASGLALVLAPSSRRNRWRTPLAGSVLAFVVVCFLSTYAADEPRLLPLKFTLRICAGAVAFALTSWALAGAPRVRFLLAAFAAAGGLAAAPALLDALSLPPVESLLAPFREHAFEVGGRPRAAGTFVYPNIAAGFLVITLPAALYFVVDPATSRGPRTLASAGALVLFAAILLTYSRGALLGAVGGSVLFWFLLTRAKAEGAPRLGWLHAGFVVLALGASFHDPAFRWRASTENDLSWYRASIVPEKHELELTARELTRTPVTVRNTGKLTWVSEGEKPFHLSYRWFVSDGAGALEPFSLEGERSKLAGPLAPGDTAEILATVRAPAQPGSYILIWDMVHEHTTWFSDKLGLGTPVRVLVGEAARAREPRPRELKKQIASQAWRPGRRELWSLAWRLFRERPLLGVGPDNFRWQYGPAAGRATWDTRTFANSLYLEILATTGIAGAIAFFVLVGRALTGMIRAGSLSLEAIALLCSLTGVLVHGVFDYLLEATPIYLAFWIVLGAASALIRREATR